MKLTFYKSDKSFSIRPTQHCEKNNTHVWINNEECEGGQFDADEVFAVIYDAIKKYFDEKF